MFWLLVHASFLIEFQHLVILQKTHDVYKAAEIEDWDTV